MNYPLHIESKLPAFYNNSIKIPFSLGRVITKQDIKTVELRLMTLLGNQLTNKKTSNIYYDMQNNNYYASFTVGDDVLKGTEGQYFKVQIRFYDEKKSDSPWSQVGIIKHTNQPTVSIDQLDVNADNVNVKTFIGVYKNLDRTEKVYSYRFSIYDFDNNLLTTSGDLIHNTLNDEIIGKEWCSSDTWQADAELVDGVKYRLVYSVKTINNCFVETRPYIIKNSTTVDANFPAKLLATVDNDNGYVSLSLIKPKEDRNESLITGNFVISRYSDNLKTWNEVCRFNLLSQYPSAVGTLWTDYTIEHGVKYLYAIQAYNSKGLYSNKIYSVVANGNTYIENDEDGNPYYILANFDDAFLTDGERQLKIRFNPKVSSFKTNILESKIDTLGGQYPFIFRNGNVKYNEFPISGLLSYLGDEQELFTKGIKSVVEDLRRPFTAAAGSEQHRYQAAKIPESGTKLTSENFYRERQFKMQALEWLMDGKPKLFRSPGEGSYIVRLMNVSLTPNDTLGRMLHTFNATAYEIADYNFTNLNQYELLNLPESENRTMKFVQIKLSDYPNPYNPGYGMYGAYILDAYATGNDTEGTIYVLKFEKAGDKIITIGATGAYYINVDKDDVLVQVEKISGDDNNTATLTYGYYDTSEPDSFSYISFITTSDEISQIIGYDSQKNIIEDKINNIRHEAGRFYQITAQKRHIETITGKEPDNWSDATIYLKNGIYYSGKPANDNSLGTKEPEAYFKLNDRYIIDLSTGNAYLSTDKLQDPQPSNPDAEKHFACITQGRYWVATDFGNISSIHVSPGALVDLSYELKEIEYTVEETNETVKKAKQKWLDDKTQSNYNDYIYALTAALAEEGVKYAL